MSDERCQIVYRRRRRIIVIIIIIFVVASVRLFGVWIHDFARGTLPPWSHPLGSSSSMCRDCATAHEQTEASGGRQQRRFSACCTRRQAEPCLKQRCFSGASSGGLPPRERVTHGLRHAELRQTNRIVARQVLPPMLPGERARQRLEEQKLSRRSQRKACARRQEALA